MLANPPLQEAVIAALERDRRIPDPLTIAVSAQGNVVTLRGVAATFRQRHAAIDDVRQIEGVRGIDDQLRVKLGPMDRREDDEIRAAALQALIQTVSHQSRLPIATRRFPPSQSTSACGTDR